MSDTKLKLDKWDTYCPICEHIVEHEDWPRIIQCGEIDDPEVVKGEKHPPCLLCCSMELEENFITVPTKNLNAMTHTRLLRCPSCGVGRDYRGVDAITGKPSVVFHVPPELDHMKLRQEMERHLEQGEQNEELLQKVKFAIALDAFFRPHQFYCLDTGWDTLGYGIRPLDRTEIMTRFYSWTNREAMDEAGADDNPLKKKKKEKKKGKWWNR